MASLSGYREYVPATRGVGLVARRTADTREFGAFRAMAEQGYDRSLSALVEHEIIPRLIVAHGSPAAPSQGHESGAAPSVAIVAADIEALAPLTLQIEADLLLAQVDAILARGVGVDTLMVDLLAPTARLLGQYWEDDRCDFVDVTMGLWRLQEVVHEIAGRRTFEQAPADEGSRALFASMPGDQHDFGTVVIEELFSRNGWITDRLCGARADELVRHVGRDWLDLVGLTISCDCHIEGLPQLIATLRNISRNPRVSVMVGGRVFGGDAGLALRVGADGTAGDAKRALQIARELVRGQKTDAAVLT